MIVTQTYDIANNSYSCTLVTEANVVEQALMDAYGEPQIDVGGTIPYTSSGNVSLSYNLPTPNTKFIRSSMPVTFTVDGNQDAEANGKIRGWGAEMAARIGSVMTTLKLKPLVNLPDNVFTEV